METLISWIGTQDLNAPEDKQGRVGPVCAALTLNAKAFARAVLISNQEEGVVKDYLQWLRSRTSVEIVHEHVELSDPTDIAEIYPLVEDIVCRRCEEEEIGVASRVYHISPGTSQMAISWFMLSKIRFPGDFIQASREAGVTPVNLPFEVAAEFQPQAIASADQQIVNASRSASYVDSDPKMPLSSPMAKMWSRVDIASRRHLPVLLYGEVGTEKELVAKALHEKSPRKGKQYLQIDCEDTPLSNQIDEADWIEELFQRSAEGTLFLDNIDKLDARYQRALRRQLDFYREAPKSQLAGPRVIAASRTNLLEATRTGDFNEELYYTLAVLLIEIPPLRTRKGEVGLEIDKIMERINSHTGETSVKSPLAITPAARSILLQHQWPGNLRELENTILRSTIWANSDRIKEEDILLAMINPPHQPQLTEATDELGATFSLPDRIASISRHYIQEAIAAADGNKTQAAKLLGLPSYQTLTNWMRKYGI